MLVAIPFRSLCPLDQRETRYPFLRIVYICQITPCVHEMEYTCILICKVVHVNGPYEYWWLLLLSPFCIDHAGITMSNVAHEYWWLLLLLPFCTDHTGRASWILNVMNIDDYYCYHFVLTRQGGPHEYWWLLLLSLCCTDHTGWASWILNVMNIECHECWWLLLLPLCIDQTGRASWISNDHEYWWLLLLPLCIDQTVRASWIFNDHEYWWLLLLSPLTIQGIQWLTYLWLFLLWCHYSTSPCVMWNAVFIGLASPYSVSIDQ